jgi:hypothetical protein
MPKAGRTAAQRGVKLLDTALAPTWRLACEQKRLFCSHFLLPENALLLASTPAPRRPLPLASHRMVTHSPHSAATWFHRPDIREATTAACQGRCGYFSPLGNLEKQSKGINP